MSIIHKLATMKTPQSSTLEKIMWPVTLIFFLLLGAMIISIIQIDHRRNQLEQELKSVLKAYNTMESADTIHGYQAGARQLVDMVARGPTGRSAVAWLILTAESQLNERYFESSSVEFFRQAIYRLRGIELHLYLNAYRDSIHLNASTKDRESTEHEFWKDLSPSEIDAIKKCLSTYDEVMDRPFAHARMAVDLLLPGIGLPECNLSSSVLIRKRNS